MSSESENFNAVSNQDSSRSKQSTSGVIAHCQCQECRRVLHSLSQNMTVDKTSVKSELLPKPPQPSTSRIVWPLISIDDEEDEIQIIEIRTRGGIPLKKENDIQNIEVQSRRLIPSQLKRSESPISVMKPSSLFQRNICPTVSKSSPEKQRRPRGRRYYTFEEHQAVVDGMMTILRTNPRASLNPIFSKMAKVKTSILYKKARSEFSIRSVAIVIAKKPELLEKLLRDKSDREIFKKAISVKTK